MIAKLEMIKPIKVFVTPKVRAKIGMAGIIRPKPIATKKEIVVSTDTSRGSPLNGEFNFKRATLQQHLVELKHAHGYLEAVSLLEIAQREIQSQRLGMPPRKQLGMRS